MIVDGATGSPCEFTVEGTTFSPHGAVTALDGNSQTALLSDPVQRMAEISAICNDAKIVYNSVRAPSRFHTKPINIF